MSIEKPPTKDVPLSTYLLRVLEQLESAISVCRTNIVTGDVKNPVKGRLYLVTTSLPQFGSQGLFYYNGTQFVKISDVTSAISLGVTHDKAYYGDFGEVAYQHSKILGNPHKTTAANIGLENVDNTSDLSKPISIAVSTALQGYVLKTTKINNKPLDGDITLNTSNISPVSARQYVTADEKLRLNTPADASHDGYLLSTDWVIFNGKQNALGFTPENILNKVTAWSAPTDAQYPSAKLVNDTFAALQDLASKIHTATNKATPVDADEFGIYDSVTGLLNKVTWSNIKATLKTYFDTLYPDTSGWIALGACTYETADSPTFQFSIAADVTGFIGVGNRIKLTQTTVKYFIVTAVGAFSGGKTIITVYGGTDYALANAAITSPFFSIAKAPFGFPLAKEKWTITVTDASLRSQLSPTQNTWYNLGGLSIIVHIGLWDLGYSVCLYSATFTTTATNMQATLSTTNNSETDSGLTVFHYLGSPAIQNILLTTVSSDNKKSVSVAAKTTMYLNGRTTIASQDSINFDGFDSKTIIKAVSALL